jgi:hypothetical protein
MLLSAYSNAIFHCPRQRSACHAGSICQSVKHIDTLEEASELDRPVEVTETTVPITLKLPPSTVERLRKYARGNGLTIGAIVTAALNAFLRTLRKDG